jgi:hypothetical protein
MQSQRKNVILIAIVFQLAFLSYFTEEVLPAVQFIPLALFALIVLIQTILTDRRWADVSLLSGDGSLVVWLIPLFTLGCSLASRFDKSFSYWVIDFVMLVLARLYTTRVPAEDVFEGFFWAGIGSLSILLFVAFQTIVETISTVSRLEVLAFHPNTLGFILSGFLAVMIWQACVGAKWKKALALTGVVVCLGLIFLASSRGSLLAVIIGSSISIALYLSRTGRFWLPTLGSVVAIIAIVLVSQSSFFDQTADYADQVLQISAGDRGLGSGLSGRTDEWKRVITQMSQGSWLYGNGMRASDGLPFSVDNGFLVVLFDLGIIPFLLIVGRVVRMLWRFPRRYLVLGRGTDLLLTMLIVIYFVANFVERLLFGVGNPFSLLMFLIFVSPWAKYETIQTRPGISGLRTASQPSDCPAS